jgi:2',3'-cyclic-nucleotide 2'-phosphodiesterase (5'-nucleotidase family)
MNDTYKIEERSPDVPGLARIAWLVKRISRLVEERLGEDRTLVLHSGDFLSPSFMGRALECEGKGRQMIELLNHCEVDYALIGNHEFDFGEDVLKQRLAEARFGLVASNFKPIKPGDYPPFHKLVLWPPKDPFLAIAGFGGHQTTERAKKSGFRLTQLASSVRTAVARVRADPRIGALVALTHMNRDEDKTLQARLNKAWHKNGFAYVLGGHDHDIGWQEPGSKSILAKNLSNCRSVSVVLLTKSGVAAPAVDSLRNLLRRKTSPDAAARIELLRLDDEAREKDPDATEHDAWRHLYPPLDEVIDSAVSAWRATVPAGVRPDFAEAFERQIRDVPASFGSVNEIRYWGFDGLGDHHLIEHVAVDARESFRNSITRLPNAADGSNSLMALPRDAAAQEAIDGWTTRLDQHLGSQGQGVVRDFSDVLGHDGRLNAVDADVRMRSTDFGNFVADAVRVATDAELALVNAGSFRADDCVPARITARDLNEMFLFDDDRAVTVVELTADEVRDLLDHAVSIAGRGGFLQTSEAGAITRARDGRCKVAIVRYLLVDPGDGYQDILARRRGIASDLLGASMMGEATPLFRLIDLVGRGAAHVSWCGDKRIEGAASVGKAREAAALGFIKLTDAYIAICAKAGMNGASALDLLAMRPPGELPAQVLAARQALREFVVAMWKKRRGYRALAHGLYGTLMRGQERFKRRIDYELYLARTMDGLWSQDRSASQRS